MLEYVLSSCWVPWPQILTLPLNVTVSPSIAVAETKTKTPKLCLREAWRKTGALAADGSPGRRVSSPAPHREVAAPPGSWGRWSRLTSRPYLPGPWSRLTSRLCLPACGPG